MQSINIVFRNDTSPAQLIIDAAHAYAAVQQRSPIARQHRINGELSHELQVQHSFASEELASEADILFKNGAAATVMLADAIKRTVEQAPHASTIDQGSNATISFSVAQDFASDPAKFGSIKRNTLMSMLGANRSFDTEQTAALASINSLILELGKNSADRTLAAAHERDSGERLGSIDRHISGYAKKNGMAKDGDIGRPDKLAARVAAHASKAVLTQLDLVLPADLKAVKSRFPAIASTIEKLTRQHPQHRIYGHGAALTRPQQCIDR